MSLRMDFINSLLVKGNQQGFFVVFEDKITKKIYHNDLPRTEECPDQPETIFVNNKADFMKHVKEIFRLKASNLNVNEPYGENVPRDYTIHEDFTANYDSNRDSFQTKISEYLSSQDNDEHIDSRAHWRDNTEGGNTGVNGRFPSTINIVKRPENGKSFKNVDFDQSYVINSNFDFVNENDLYDNMINCERNTLPTCDDPDAVEIVSDINERINSLHDISKQYRLGEYDVQNLSDMQPGNPYHVQQNNLKENVYNSYDPLPESSITHPNPNEVSNFDYSDSERNISKHVSSTQGSFSNKNNKRLKSTSTVQGSDSESKENPQKESNKNDPNNIDNLLYRKASSITDIHYKDSERSILKDSDNEKQIFESMKLESAISSHLNKSIHSLDNRLNSIPSNLSYATAPYEHPNSAKSSSNALSNVEFHDSGRSTVTNIIPDKLGIKQSKQYNLITLSERQHSPEYILNNTKDSDKTINRNIESITQYNDQDRQSMKNRDPYNLDEQQFDLLKLSDRPSFQENHLKDTRESDFKTQNKSIMSNVQYRDSDRQAMTNMAPNNLERHQSKQFDLITISNRQSLQESNLKDKTEMEMKTKRGSDVSTEIEFVSTQSQGKCPISADNSAKNIINVRDTSDQCCEITTEPDESLNVLGCGEKETNIQSFNTRKSLIAPLLKETTQNVPHDSISIRKSLKQQDTQNQGEGSLNNQKVMINKSVYVKYDTKDDQVYNSCSQKCSKKCLYGVDQCLFNLQKLFQ